MSKVRRIDWSPDEWIAGTVGVLTMHQAAVYMAVLMQVYSRGGQCPNDAAFIGGQFRPEGEGKHRQSWAAHTMHARRALDHLIKLGKLRVSADGQSLTNGRAEIELGKAQGRITSAQNAGHASGRVRRDRPRPTPSQPQPNTHANPTPMGSVSSETNGLDRTAVRNHHHHHHDHTITTTTSSVAARETEAGSGGGGEGSGHDLERLRKWRVPDELEARLQKQRPDITTDQRRWRTREWREYAAENGVPRNFEASWYGFLLRTPRRRRIRSIG